MARLPTRPGEHRVRGQSPERGGRVFERTESESLLHFDIIRRYAIHKRFMGAEEKPGGFVQGTLDLLMPKTLNRRAIHGYDIAEFIQATSNSVRRAEERALYPALHHLELRSGRHRPAKYYRVIAAGRKRSAAESQYRSRMTAAIALINGWA